MPVQLRIYTIKRGCLKEWVSEWETKIKPLREKFGFEISGAWTLAETNQFVWILKYDGPENWDKLDKDFHQSEERQSMTPDPGRNIAGIEHYFIDPV